MWFLTLSALWRSRRAGPRKPVRSRLEVEVLENRRVPANFTAATVPELIAAIDAANLTPEADTLSLAAGTTFTLTRFNNLTDGANGLPVTASGEDLTVLGNGATIERKTSRNGFHFRLFDVAVGATLTLQDLTMRGGSAFGPDGDAQGGAVRNGGTLNLDGVTLEKCEAVGMRSTLDRLSDPSASGGGIYSDGTLTVVNSRIESNAAVAGKGADARRIVSAITGEVFYDFPTRGGDARGGGIYVAGGSATILNTTIAGNIVAGGDGGDGLGDIFGAPGGTGHGGGMYCNGGTVTLLGVTVTANQAKGGAGGNGSKGHSGANGTGVGGGIFIAPEAAVGIDAFTVSHTKKNYASTADDNGSGSYDLIG